MTALLGNSNGPTDQMLLHVSGSEHISFVGA